MHLPQLRTKDIIEQEAKGELLIYDLRINKAYNLNETSKIVYLACNGVTSFDDLKRRHGLTDDLIHLALSELRANDLIEGELTNHFVGLTRRQVIRRVGLASMIALPLITGLAVPAAAHASSTPAACNTTCTCSNPNPNELTALCRSDLSGTASGCTSQVAGCDCAVAPFSSSGTCEPPFVID